MHNIEIKKENPNICFKQKLPEIWHPPKRWTYGRIYLDLSWSNKTLKQIILLFELCYFIRIQHWHNNAGSSNSNTYSVCNLSGQMKLLRLNYMLLNLILFIAICILCFIPTHYFYLLQFVYRISPNSCLR